MMDNMQAPEQADDSGANYGAEAADGKASQKKGLPDSREFGHQPVDGKYKLNMLNRCL